MKKLLLALSSIFLTFSALAEDGITSGKLYFPNDNTTPIGECISLKKGGKTVYQRFRFNNARDFKYSEHLMIDGKTMLELRHLPKSLGFIFSSYKDYIVSTSVTDFKIDKITVSSVKESAVYVWKRDSEGFYSAYTNKRQSDAFPIF